MQRTRTVRVLAVLVLTLFLPAGCTAPAAVTPAPETSPPVTAAPMPALTPALTPEPTPAPTPQPTPQPTPGPTPEPTLPERLLAEMSLREKLCQLLVLWPGDLAGGRAVTEMNDALRAAVGETPVGGFFLNAENMRDSAQLKALTAALTEASALPPIIVCDEEGGSVSRLMRTVGTTKIGAMYSYRDRGTETAYANAETIGRDLLAHGLNADFAPVADVWSNPDNPVIRTRAYSDDFAEAAELVAAAVEGFHAGGVACTLKHFPGHGDTAADSHDGPAVVTKSLDELREEELLPFAAGIEAGADMVMIGHLTVPALDELPAPFSRAAVTDLLRGELGFDGVVITDALQMGALGDYGDGETAVLALLAGVDLLLCPGDWEKALAALTEAVTAGELSEERIDESVLRVLRMKEARGLLS